MPKKVERFGPEWWLFYAAAWQARWDWKARFEGNSAAVATMCRQDADDGIAAFNSMIDRGTA